MQSAFHVWLFCHLNRAAAIPNHALKSCYVI